MTEIVQLYIYHSQFSCTCW